MILAKKGSSKTREAVDYYAKMNIYNTMAHYVGGKLSINPHEIMRTWSGPQLIVTFGHFANLDAFQEYEMYKSLSPEQRKGAKKPKKYAVEFMTRDEIGAD